MLRYNPRMTYHEAASIVGLVSDIIGAWFVAFEVVRKFEGEMVRVKPWNVDTDIPEITPEYRAWEQRRNRWMKRGLGFLTFGFAFQALGVIVHS